MMAPATIEGTSTLKWYVGSTAVEQRTVSCNDDDDRVEGEDYAMLLWMIELVSDLDVVVFDMMVVIEYIGVKLCRSMILYTEEQADRFEEVM